MFDVGCKFFIVGIGMLVYLVYLDWFNFVIVLFIIFCFIFRGRGMDLCFYFMGWYGGMLVFVFLFVEFLLFMLLFIGSIGFIGGVLVVCFICMLCWECLLFLVRLVNCNEGCVCLVVNLCLYGVSEDEL